MLVKVHLKNCLDRYIHIHSDNFILIFSQPFPNGGIFYRYLYLSYISRSGQRNFIIHLQASFSDFQVDHLSCRFCIFKKNLTFKTAAYLYLCMWRGLEESDERFATQRDEVTQRPKLK